MTREARITFWLPDGRSHYAVWDPKDAVEVQQLNEYVGGIPAITEFYDIAPSANYLDIDGTLIEVWAVVADG